MPTSAAGKQSSCSNRVWDASPSQHFCSLCSAMKSLTTAVIPLGEGPEQSSAPLMPTPQLEFSDALAEQQQGPDGNPSHLMCIGRLPLRTPAQDLTGLGLSQHTCHHRLRVTVRNSSIPGCSWSINSCDLGPCWLLGQQNQMTRDKSMVLCTDFRCLPLSLKQSRISLLLQKPKLSFT